MQRRRARDPLDNLELGNQLSLTRSIPMKKLTRMSVVKYLILILIAILLHTTYRLLWRAQEGVSLSQNENEEIKEFDSFKKGRVIDPVVDGKVNKNSESGQEENDEDEKSEFAKKIERFEKFKNAIEIAKKEINSEKRANNQNNAKKDPQRSHQSEYEKQNEHLEKIEQVKISDNKRREAMELEKEQIIESKIAEIVNEAKEKEARDKEARNKEAKVNVNVVGEANKESQSLDRKPPSLPEPDKSFLEKAKQINKAAEEKLSAIRTVYSEHGKPVIVTAGRSSKFEQVKHLIYSVQKFLPREKIYVFDLDLSDRQRKHLMAACNVRVREFWSNLFPKYVSKWNNYHWRPLVIQTALAEFGHIIWINPGYVLTGGKLGSVIEDDNHSAVRVFGQSQIHTTYAVTERSMYKYLPTDKKRLSESPHIEIYGLLLHNTDELRQKFLNLLVACAMEEQCMAPPKAQWMCDFDFTGKQYAGCHRYDESAMNILLKNWFDFDNMEILSTPRSLKEYKPNELNTLRMCRDEEDMLRHPIR